MRGLMRWLGCLTVAALLLGGAARAEERKDGKQAEKKQQKKDDGLEVPFPGLDELFDALGGGLTDEQMKEFRQQMQKMGEAMKQLQRGGGFGGFGGFGPMPGGMPAVRRASVAEARLGARLREPSAAMADQLDLPKDQGQVLEEVGPNSPAAKAGLKEHDVLLEVNGQAVPRKRDELEKVLSGVAADKSVDAVVMRKGKKETLKGLKLPQAKAAAQPAPLRLGRPGVFGGLKNGMTAVTRNNDEFTAKHSAGGVTSVVKGTASDGKATPSEITIEADGKSSSYASVEKVPAEHQETVKKLLALGGRSR